MLVVKGSHSVRMTVVSGEISGTAGGVVWECELSVGRHVAGTAAAAV